MPKDLPLMSLATDMVIFNIRNFQLHILLVQRKTEPFTGSWCLPGGIVYPDMTVEGTAYKVLYKETGLVPKYMKQFAVFADIHRDPRARVVGIGYYTIICDNDLIPQSGQTQLNAMFVPLTDIPALAFDHDIVRKQAYKQLQKDIEGSDIVKYFLPKLFTLDLLKQYCEVVYGRTFEKRNFIKYITSRFKIQKTKHKEQYVAHRPAALYKFVA
ncbi:MAG: NUDIX domain-containing protein [Candidatus Absconditabacterales bacterium]